MRGAAAADGGAAVGGALALLRGVEAASAGCTPPPSIETSAIDGGALCGSASAAGELGVAVAVAVAVAAAVDDIVVVSPPSPTTLTPGRHTPELLTKGSFV